MTNGVLDITVNGKPLRLRFNMPAALLFQSFMAETKAKAGSMESNILLLGELFYCGIYGECFRSKKPCPSHEEAMDLFDAFGAEETFITDTEKMWRVWGESAIGTEMIRDAGKKKELDNLQPSK